MVYVLARPCPEYLKSKMDIRNFIIDASGDTEYALSKNKEVNIRPYLPPENKQRAGVLYSGTAQPIGSPSPDGGAGIKSEDLRMIAITSDGDIITKENAKDYLTIDVFTKPIRELCNV